MKALILYFTVASCAYFMNKIALSLPLLFLLTCYFYLWNLFK
ncbi:hypothetical protein PROVRETT_07171 [Providencia rettgeri DSM 1131]|nr:hypothetical protein PROVRETT_07171 [Providencia rettgeri DSM 1131]